MSTDLCATYRVQFHAGFGFADAAAIADYLADLGISHLYCSPYLQAASCRGLVIKLGGDWGDTTLELPDGPWQNVLGGDALLAAKSGLLRSSSGSRWHYYVGKRVHESKKGLLRKTSIYLLKLRAT